MMTMIPIIVIKGCMTILKTDIVQFKAEIVNEKDDDNHIDYDADDEEDSDGEGGGGPSDERCADLSGAGRLTRHPLLPHGACHRAGLW